MANAQVRILIAEDELLVAEVMKLTLSRQGWQVDVVGDGLEAVERAVVGDYDLILMDHRMPRCSGLEAAQRILTLRPDQQIAMVTGSPTDKGLREIVKKEGLYQLTKPFSPDELVKAIGGWLESQDKVKKAKKER